MDGSGVGNGGVRCRHFPSMIAKFSGKPMSRHQFADVADLARSQHGLITTGQLTAVGVASGTITRWVECGRLDRLAPCVHRVGGAPPSWAQSVLCTCLAGGPQCAASHRTAAALWSLDGSRRGIVEVVGPRWGRRVRSVGRHHESLNLAPTDITTSAGIPLTTVNRTLIDVAAYYQGQRLEQLVDDAVRRELTSYTSLRQRFMELARRGRPGVRAMRAVLDHRDGGVIPPGSTFENRMLTLLRERGFRPPVRQVRVDAQGLRFYIDMGWTDLRVGVECDSSAHHATPWQLARDAERRNLLMLAGWSVVQVTWAALVQRPDSVARTVRAALALAQGSRGALPVTT